MMFLLNRLQNLDKLYEELWNEMLEKEGYEITKKRYGHYCMRCWIGMNITVIATLFLNAVFLHITLISILCIMGVCFGNLYFLQRWGREWDFDRYYSVKKE